MACATGLRSAAGGGSCPLFEGEDQPAAGAGRVGVARARAGCSGRRDGAAGSRPGVAGDGFGCSTDRVAVVPVCCGRLACAASH